MVEGPLRSRLLVATPVLGDPNFDRTVVLMVDHGEQGALGVVLNRPSETGVAGLLPGWARFAGEPPVVFVGGPVAPTAVMCLARTVLSDSEAWTPVLDGVGLLDLGEDPDGLAAAIDEIRVFAGYAGWGEGQLEAEIEAGAWFVVEARPDDVLSSRPDELWRTVLRRQQGDLAMFALFPADASLN